MLRCTAEVPGGSTVAVIGCGGIGLNIIQGCRIAGAAKIIAIDIVDSKLDMASRFGRLIQSTPRLIILMRPSWRLPVAKGVLVEAIGVPAAATQAFNILRPGGTCTVVGMHPLGQRFHSQVQLSCRRRKFWLHVRIDSIPSICQN